MPLWELRLWRDSLAHSVEVAHGEHPEDQFLHDRTLDGVSIADRIVASIEMHLITAGIDLDDA